MGKFHDLKTFPNGLWGGGFIIIKHMVIRRFNYAEQNSNLKILIGRFREKWRERECNCPQLFGHLKKGTRSFNFH